MSMADRDGLIWSDGKMVPWRDATTHVLTHTLHYGMGVFEGLRAYQTNQGTAIFRLLEHTERLFNSAHIFMMKIPYDKATLMEAQLEVVKQNKIYEVRKYPDRLAIETIASSQGSSFRKLFNYISGNNEKNEEIKMTTPVTQVEKKGNMTMQFYLPLKYNKNNVPIPSRPDVEIVTIEGGYFAVIRYSGRSSDKNFI